MSKVIVNADDCGYSAEVNEHIREAIARGKLSSTTIIANMDDFDGAVKLYNECNDRISFGIHLNLTEGRPLLHSEELLQAGFYKVVDGEEIFNGSAFRYRYLSGTARASIKLELNAQIQKLKEAGISISHIDSHHHIHTAPFFLPIVLDVAKRNGINKIRRAGDLFMKGSRVYRTLWLAELRHFSKSVKVTDHFYGFDEFLSMEPKFKGDLTGCVVELMTHPGGKYHPEEEKLLLEYTFDESGYNLISYNQL